MNKTILMDKLWDIYSLLPHCQIIMRIKSKEARKAFQYEKGKDISIIAVNCIGGEIYSILDLPFLSPFINTAMNRKHYITMCEHLEKYMASQLIVQKTEDEHYIGIISPAGLPSVRVRFDHDNDPIEILNKWNRRKERINWGKILLICDDKDITEEDFQRFDAIQRYKKIMLTAKDLSKVYNWCYQLKAYKNKKTTGTYNGKSFFGGWKFQYIWDYVSYINETFME